LNAAPRRSALETGAAWRPSRTSSRPRSSRRSRRRPSAGTCRAAKILGLLGGAGEAPAMLSVRLVA